MSDIGVDRVVLYDITSKHADGSVAEDLNAGPADVLAVVDTLMQVEDFSVYDIRIRRVLPNPPFSPPWKPPRS